MSAAVLAVDVGNSKTDAALVAADGSVLAAVRGSTASHQRVGMAAGADLIVGLVEAMLGGAPPDTATGGGADGRAPAALRSVDPLPRPVARVLVCCAAGADLPSEERLLGRALRERGLADTTVVRNDTFAVLRAGSERTWGVAVVCGSGVNCAGRSPGGRTYRIPALGPISGDWGGGQALGEAALAAAVRARDGRGPRTSLEISVPAAFGLRRPLDVTLALYRGRLPERRLGELAPVVFADAGSGDAVARGIVDRLADELVTMVAAAIRRLHLVRSDPDVVLGGGVFRTEEPGFHARLAAGVAAVAPRARIRRLEEPPVVGAALLGLDVLAAEGTRSRGAVAHAERRAAEATLRRGLTHASFEGRAPRAVD